MTDRETRSNQFSLRVFVLTVDGLCALSAARIDGEQDGCAKLASHLNGEAKTGKVKMQNPKCKMQNEAGSDTYRRSLTVLGYGTIRAPGTRLGRRFAADQSRHLTTRLDHTTSPP